MPKLLQINTTLNCSSTGRIAEQIALLAQSKDWDCYIAHGGRYIGKSAIKTYQISSDFDNKLHAVKSMACGMHGLGSTAATVKFVKWIKSLKPDIIHLHNIHGYYLNYQVLFDYLGKADIPVVWTLHDCWTMTGQCTHFVEADCEKWKTGCHDCQLLQYGYKTYVDRSEKNWLLKNNMFNLVKNMTLVTVSKWLESVVKESILKKYPTKVIYNGIDLNIFTPSTCSRQSLGLNNKFTVLGVSSGWGKAKGLNEFIELSKIPELQVVLIGVQDALIGKLPKEIKAIKRTNNQAELVAYYSLADVFVNPSHADSFPTVNLEAMACGTPVVAYNVTGSPEAIDEQTGIIVPKNNLDELKLAINAIREKGKAYYSRNCIEKARREYEKGARFNDYIALYNRLLGGGINSL